MENRESFGRHLFSAGKENCNKEKRSFHVNLSILKTFQNQQSQSRSPASDLQFAVDDLHF